METFSNTILGTNGEFHYKNYHIRTQELLDTPRIGPILNSDSTTVDLKRPPNANRNRAHRRANMNTQTIEGLKVTIRDGYGKASDWDSAIHGDHYRVTVSANGKRTTFDYWNSQHDSVNGIDPDPRDALDCWLGDCLAGLMTFEDFCGEFGMDQDSRAYKMWQAGVRSSDNAERIGLSEDDLYRLSEIVRA